ncbi:MAG TPA: YigZ family protein [Rhodanobacteraceae bacterium]|nr:YigZ family protein [Rhodanobacteraceae bacterium]
MTNPLVTLAAPCSHAVEIRKSRFLAQAAPASSPKAALAFVDSLRGNGGSHHCWAWRIGQACRFNDDGEPSSSAGKPILAAIDGQGFDHVVVVVTRWFGGVKLGVGGLIRAYGGTAAQCLQQAARQPLVHVTRMALHCDFARWALLEGRIRERDIAIENTTFGALAVEAILAVPSGQESALAHLVADATQGRGSLVSLPENCS